MKNNLLIRIGIFFDDFVSRISPNKNKINNRTRKKVSLAKGISVLSKRKINSKKDVKKREQSQVDSQGVSRFSGSSYNGQGNVDNAKIRYNRKRR